MSHCLAEPQERRGPHLSLDEQSWGHYSILVKFNLENIKTCILYVCIKFGFYFYNLYYAESNQHQKTIQ